MKFACPELVEGYDSTNTYMEGEAADNPKAKHGRSKETCAEPVEVDAPTARW